jgi:hypothetical protein
MRAFPHSIASVIATMLLCFAFTTPLFAFFGNFEESTSFFFTALFALTAFALTTSFTLFFPATLLGLTGETHALFQNKAFSLDLDEEAQKKMPFAPIAKFAVFAGLIASFAFLMVTFFGPLFLKEAATFLKNPTLFSLLLVFASSILAVLFVLLAIKFKILFARFLRRVFSDAANTQRNNGFAGAKS